MNKRLILVVLVGIVTTQAYQNCGQLAGFQADGDLSLSSSFGALDHPSTIEPTLPVQKNVTMNRQATASLLREIFTSVNTPVPGLESILYSWMVTRSPQFGYACNPYDTHTGRDCGDINNAGTTVMTDDSTLREAFRVQACENILGYDQGVYAALEKITRTAAAPDTASVGQMYELFYRAEAADAVSVQALIEMDRTLTANGESVLDRWRAVTLQICTSTGWQLL